MALVPCLHSSPMYSGLALSICKCGLSSRVSAVNSLSVVVSCLVSCVTDQLDEIWPLGIGR